MLDIRAAELEEGTGGRERERAAVMAPTVLAFAAAFASAVLPVPLFVYLESRKV